MNAHSHLFRVEMPTYVYRREDGTTFEQHQRITDDPLEECPETGQSVERIITGRPVVLHDQNTGTDGYGADEPAAHPSPCCGPSCGI